MFVENILKTAHFTVDKNKTTTQFFHNHTNTEKLYPEENSFSINFPTLFNIRTGKSSQHTFFPQSVEKLISKRKITMIIKHFTEADTVENFWIRYHKKFITQ